jgi:hypothetical protein
MTTYGPASRFVPLFERLAAAELVVVARAHETLEEWTDPSGDPTLTFAIVQVEVEEALRGKVKGAIRVRVASRPGEEDDSPASRLASGKPVLLILAKDEDGDPPRYGVQHGSAFVVDGDAIDVPADIPLGDVEVEEGKFGLTDVRRMLAQLAAVDKERRRRYAEVDAEWEAREYPEVQEVAKRPAKERAEPGPRDSRPVSEIRAEARGQRSTRPRRPK